MRQCRFKYDVLSLFAGGGFLDLGFHEEGFNIAEAVEVDPWFIEGYNFAFEKILAINDVVVVFPCEPATTIFFLREIMCASISPLL